MRADHVITPSGICEGILFGRNRRLLAEQAVVDVPLSVTVDGFRVEIEGITDRRRGR